MDCPLSLWTDTVCNLVDYVCLILVEHDIHPRFTLLGLWRMCAF